MTQDFNKVRRGLTPSLMLTRVTIHIPEMMDEYQSINQVYSYQYHLLVALDWLSSAGLICVEQPIEDC